MYRRVDDGRATKTRIHTEIIQTDLKERIRKRQRERGRDGEGDSQGGTNACHNHTCVEGTHGPDRRNYAKMRVQTKKTGGGLSPESYRIISCSRPLRQIMRAAWAPARKEKMKKKKSSHFDFSLTTMEEAPSTTTNERPQMHFYPTDSIITEQNRPQVFS